MKKMASTTDIAANAKGYEYLAGAYEAQKNEKTKKRG